MRVLLLCLFFSFSQLLFSQRFLEGKVLDVETGNAVPYANVYLKNHKVGATAFRNGEFRIELDSLFLDSVVVSCMGYEERKFYLPDFITGNTRTVELRESREILYEVEVLPREIETLVAGMDRRRAKYCSGSVDKYPHARHITNDHQLEGFIKSVSVYICDEGVFYAPFRVNLLKIDPLTGKPGGPLISEDFILRTDEGGQWVTIDLEERLLPFPLSGFCVAVQGLPLDSSQIAEYLKDFPELSSGQIMVKAPSFGQFSEDFKDAATRNWSYGWWGDEDWQLYWLDYFAESGREVTPSSNVSSLMVKAEIDYYSDQELKFKKVKPKRKLKKVVEVPKADYVTYPQNSPMALLQSMRKAISGDDLAYLCTHLFYYDTKDDLEEMQLFLEGKRGEAGSVVLSEDEKAHALSFMDGVEEVLPKLQKSEDDQLMYEMSLDGWKYFLQHKEGRWKMSPESEPVNIRGLGPSLEEMELPPGFRPR